MLHLPENTLSIFIVFLPLSAMFCINVGKLKKLLSCRTGMSQIPAKCTSVAEASEQLTMVKAGREECLSQASVGREFSGRSSEGEKQKLRFKCRSTYGTVSSEQS